MSPAARSPGRADVRDWRARRWDAVVLGSGIRALVAAARLGMARQRVLVVEEAATARQPLPLREPFYLGGARDGGALDVGMRELTLPLIDRRRVRALPLALQAVSAERRVDLAEPDLTADEWVAWGLAKPDEARRAIAGLVAESEAVREAALEAPWVRTGRSLGLGRGRAPAVEPAGGATTPPESVWQDAEGLGGVLGAVARALSNAVHDAPSPGARARLWGTVLAGGAGFTDGPPWLHGLLRRRVQALLGDFRTLDRGFRLVTADGVPGIAIPDSGELWLGRALVLGCPASALARFHDPEDRPSFLEPTPALRRHLVHVRVRRALLPEAMATRLVWHGEPHAAFRGGEHLAISLFRDPEAPDWVDLVARALVDADADPAELARVEARTLEVLRSLVPFAGPIAEREPGRGARSEWHRKPVTRPRWDDDEWLEPDSAGGTEIDLRVSARPAVYRLERGPLAELGLEGDLLLGWRGGDAIAAELS
jgi:hypothetical protein